jgi:Domain of unknown function (DUF5591)
MNIQGKGLPKARRKVEFHELRSDWYFGVDYVVRLLKHACAQGNAGATFSGFPRQWIVMFEWLGLSWKDSTSPTTYVPFIAGLSEDQIVKEVEAARVHGQLRQLVETVANSDVVFGDALQRLDITGLPEGVRESGAVGSIPLTSWFSYSRPEIAEFERALSAWRPQRSQAIFLPCGRARPYNRSATHRRLLEKLTSWGIESREFDLIVITSLGPVPEALWQHDVVLRYDTGVRDIYRMLVLLRRLLTQGTRYVECVDCLGFRPYRDLLSIVSREGLIGEIRRPAPIRGRTIPAYKLPSKIRTL